MQVVPTPRQERKQKWCLSGVQGSLDLSATVTVDKLLPYLGGSPARWPCLSWPSPRSGQAAQGPPAAPRGTCSGQHPAALGISGLPVVPHAFSLC